MRRNGIDAEAILDEPTHALVSVVLSYFIDDATPAGSSRAAGRELALRILRGERLDREAPYRPSEPPPPPDRETWGLLPEHIAGLERAMGMMSGGG